MFCSGCGQTVSATQNVCPRCGRPVTVPPGGAPYSAVPGVAGYPAVSRVARAAYRVQRHIQTVGILWIVYAAWTVLQVLLAATFFAGMLGHSGHHWGMGYGPFDRDVPFSFMPWLVPVLTVITVGRALLAVATGLALLRRAPWARTLALVTAFLTLLKPLTGTVLAIYTLWVLLPAASAQEYDQISEP